MRALVVGASGGIGAALVAALSRQGADVLGLSRSRDGLDITDEASIAAHLDQLSGSFDTVLVATGALALGEMTPEKSLRSLTGAALLPRDRPARFAALSARVGSIGDNALGGWYSYRAAKAALNQLIHTGAIELARSHPQAVVVSLHPGHVSTGLSAPFGGALPSVSPDAAADHILGVLDQLSPADTGGFFDWAGKPIVW
jgi:NAD(P)-dependent dehydrogenase (short-subunit alcohol dehydrogenase family)